MRGWLLFLLGGLALAGVVGWMVTSEPSASEAAARPPYVLPVSLASVRSGDLTPRVALTGEVRSGRRATLSFTTAGQLLEVTAREADRVQAGDVLARLQARDQELALEAARADLLLAESELVKLRAGAREEEKRRLTAELEAARAEGELAKVEADRVRILTQDRILSQSELDRLEGRRVAAEAQARASEERLSEALAGAREEDLRIAEVAVTQAQVRVSQAQWELDKTSLRAPWDGAVVRRAVSSGDFVERGAPVFDLVDLSNLEVVVEIPSRFAGRMSGNPKAVIRLDEEPDFELAATLTAQVQAAEDTSRNFRGIIRLTASAVGGLQPGAFVRVELETERLTNALIVPADAVRTTAQGQVVVRAASGEDGGLAAEWVPVRARGEQAGEVAVEALDGTLAAGQSIVVIGVDLAFPGASLLPRDAVGGDS